MHRRSALVGSGAVGVTFALMLVGGCSSFTSETPRDDRDAAVDAPPSSVSDALPSGLDPLDSGTGDASAMAIADAIDGGRLNDCAKWTEHGGATIGPTPAAEPTDPYESACRVCADKGAGPSYVAIALPSPSGTYRLNAWTRASVSSVNATCGIGFKRDDVGAGATAVEQGGNAWVAQPLTMVRPDAGVTSTIATLEILPSSDGTVCCDFAAVAIDYLP